MLSDRKKKILQAVIDEYIENATPVGSKSIQEAYFDSLSPATIRSELATLEELGFLTHPHTSAGRVPTNEAYKLYIDELIEKSKVTNSELNKIKSYFSSNIKETEYVSNQVVRVLTDLTNYTTVASIKSNNKDKIKSLKLIKFSENTIVLIVVMESGEVNDFRVYGNFAEGEEHILSAEKLLNKHVIGKSFVDLESLDEKVKQELYEYKELFVKIFTAIKDRVREKENLLLRGESKIFEHPEYNNIESVKDFMSVIDSKEKLKELLNEDGQNIKINVSFGGEDTELPKDCSLVSAHYIIDDVDYGTYGVIGPSRMDYGKVIKILNGIRDILKDINNNK